MIPITRIDEYLAVISQDEDATGLPDQAVTRIDTYLSKIAGEAVAELPEPVTRIDRYLASIAGMDVVMDDPITRIDYYLATVAGVYSGELPEPVTRIDHYLYQWAQGGGMPDWQTFTGNPVSFNAPKAHVLKSLKAYFSPVQDLHGYDSPWPAGGGKNKFDPSAMPSPTSSVQYHAFYVGDGTWTASTDAPYGDGNATVFFLAGNVSSGASTSQNGVSPSTGRTQTAVNGYVTVAWRTYSNINPSQYHIQIESGPSITPWTPYSNLCPISGWDSVSVWGAGENLWDEEWEEGAYTNSGTKIANNTVMRCKNPIPVVPNTTYYFKTPAPATPYTARFVFYDADNNCISSTGGMSVNATFTTPSNAHYFAFNMNSAYGTTYNHDISINYPSTDTEYHATKGISQTTLTWQDEAGTVYGGTASVAEDGTATGTDEWVTHTITGDETYGTFTQNRVLVLATKLPHAIKETGNLVCNAFKIVPSTTEPPIGCVSLYSANGNIIFGVDTSVITSMADWIAFAESINLQVAYELATPVPFTVTPSATPTAVVGINTMWTDGSNLTVKARGEAVNLNALQSLNMLLGGRYVNNHTPEDLTDEEALDIILNGGNR